MAKSYKACCSDVAFACQDLNECSNNLHRHSHAIEPRYMRIPAVKKLQLIAQLTLKRDIDTIIEEFCEVEPNHRPPSRKELIRLKSKYVDKGQTINDVSNEGVKKLGLIKVTE